MAFLKPTLCRAEVEKNSTCELFGNPAVNIACPKTPHCPELEAPHSTLPCITLKSLRMYSHDRGCLICVQQGFGNERLAGDWFAVQLGRSIELVL